MITFKLNGKKVQGEEGQFILQVAEKYGVEIPTLCHHKGLEPAGMCRLCTVELFDGRRTRFVTACNYPIWEGMEVKTDTETVHEGRKLNVELLMARCPDIPVVKTLADQYGIEKPRFKIKDDTCILCGLCTRICQRMGNSAISLTGRGVEMKVDTPFHIQTEVCMACGACAFVCPTGHISLDKIKENISTQTVIKIPSEYDAGLKGRKPIYVPYAQAVPNMPAIDRTKCVHFKTDGCKICADFCPVGAIDHSQQDEIVELDVGSIVLAPGFDVFDPSRFDTYAYTQLPNVVTSLEFERILSATGPFSGHLVRPSDHKEPQKIGWLQCVGSRDLNRCDNAYCSSVCCMYAIKQTVIATEHSQNPLDCAVFYMDMRTHGKDFDKYYGNAEKQGVRFVRSRIHTISPVPGTDDVAVRYIEEDGTVKEEVFDMFVLSVGLEINQDIADLSKRIGIDLDEYRFTKTDSFHPVGTSVEGIYACGVFTGPKDIPQSVMEASASACAATEHLASARNTCTKILELPPERDVSSEPPKIGVFVCNCGINIGGVVKVPEVVQYAKTLPNVVYVEENLFSCSQDTQDKMSDIINQQGLNRVVVAACTPKTHEPLFQETLINAGLNKYLFEMANIRNHDSWVHANDPDAATEKAKDLIRMAVAKTNLLAPLKQTDLPVSHSALVIGGGIAGMTAAVSLAHQGYPVDLVEKSDALGGNALMLSKTAQNEDVGAFVEELIQTVNSEDRITLHTETTIGNVEGFVGNFKTELRNKEATQTIEHGVAVIATGAKEYKPVEYLYGKHDAVMTHLELDELFKKSDPRLDQTENVVFIQCVGSRDKERPYCSKVCCTHSVKSAIDFKKKNPNVNVAILYRDIRTYGKKEDLYRQAREAGVLFFSYSVDQKPEVTADGDHVVVEFTDRILNRKLAVKADILCLASAIESHWDHSMAQIFKVPLDSDGWLLEAHQKLRPVDFANDGIFLCGMAHYPKPIEESIAQAQAAAARAATVLALESIKVGGIVTDIRADLCSGCLGCINVCPYGAITFDAQKYVAEVNAALCKGCGACAAVCPSEAPALMGFNNNQLYAQIKSALNA
ncbi:MAG: FAD-dependent oxidoreductase [Desulfobacterales bacterium]|jgi:heterodisulfide reductase subunit A|nr:FAD-dependent oxidoreductase [Desulfobacterales bacterium]